MAILFAPSKNFLSTALNGAISNSDTTITLTSTSGLVAPGAIVVDRVDANDVSQATLREVIAFQTINGNQIQGCTRGADGSTAQAHADGAVVETNVTVGIFNSLITAVRAFTDANGYMAPLASPASIAQLQSNILAVTSSASIAALNITKKIDVGSASIVGLNPNPVFRTQGGISGATVGIGGLLKFPRAATMSWFSVVTPNVASGASIIFDFMKNGTSIFAGVTKPTIPGGGTFVSTASINTKNFDPGDILRFDVSNANSGFIADVTGQGG